jgi:hypothetical protein
MTLPGGAYRTHRSVQNQSVGYKISRQEGLGGGVRLAGGTCARGRAAPGGVGPGGVGSGGVAGRAGGTGHGFGRGLRRVCAGRGPGPSVVALESPLPGGEGRAGGRDADARPDRGGRRSENASGRPG